ncbi:MAG: hypothetical protein SGARI_000175 [Bacillariaceae sp.]
MLTSPDPAVFVRPGELTGKRLYMGLNLLRCYANTDVHAGTFQVNWKTTSRNAWWPLEESESDEESYEEDIGEFDDSEDELELEDQYEFVAEEEGDEDFDEDYEEEKEDYDAFVVIEEEDLEVPPPLEGRLDSDDDDEDYVFVEVADIKETFFLSIDGVHCRVNEPSDPNYRKNPKYFSHKFRQAGMSYEVSMDENGVLSDVIACTE